MNVSRERLTGSLAAFESHGLTVVRRARDDRRATPRRAVDREQAVLASLAALLINKQLQPLILIDRCMTVLLINDAAERWLHEANGMHRIGRRLKFKVHEHFIRVSRVLKGEVESACFALKTVGRVTASRLKSEAGMAGFALITISTSVDTECNESLLQRRWELTVAESQVALGIFNGLSLVQVAKFRGASVNTVKTQARHVFQKCRVHSQVALTRSIWELLAAPT